MKTLELDLKKKLLIVDYENDGEMDANHRFYSDVRNVKCFINKKKIKLICKGSELTEEIASELVEKSNFQNHHKEAKINYKNHNGIFTFHTAKQAFRSTIEAKGFYWLENPLGNSKPKGILHNNGSEEVIKVIAENFIKSWQEAEAKTFKNPLIFEIIE